MSREIVGIVADATQRITRLDPLTFGLALVVLVGSAALAAFLPARRASMVDPATALREG